RALRRVRLVKPLVELLGRQPARRVVLAQQRRGAVAVRVRGTDPGVTGHRHPPQLCDCASSRGGCWARRAKPALPPSVAVSTHGPPAVMATLCSECAAGPPSSGTPLQPASSRRGAGAARTTH